MKQRKSLQTIERRLKRRKQHWKNWLKSILIVHPQREEEIWDTLLEGPCRNLLKMLPLTWRSVSCPALLKPTLEYTSSSELLDDTSLRSSLFSLQSDSHKESLHYHNNPISEHSFIPLSSVTILRLSYVSCEM